MWQRLGQPRWAAGALFLLLLLGTGAPARAESRRDVHTWLKDVRSASVEVLIGGQHKGSGAIVDTVGIAVTAAHVIGQPENKIEVLSPTAGRVEATLLVVDLGHDVALLKLPERPAGYAQVPLAGEAPRAGDDVTLLAAPLFRRAMLLGGMLAEDRQDFEYYGDLHRYTRVQYVSATVPRGTSGGIWLNAAGRLVGVQSGAMTEAGQPVGIAYMAPVSAVRALLGRRKSAATPTLGMPVEELWQHGPDVRRRFAPGSEGLVLRAPKPDGPAARAGLKEWDLLVAFEGRAVRRSGELLTAVRRHKPGEAVRLRIVAPDGAGTRDVEVTLGTLETGWP